ncbi:phospholipase D-like domain-containing protein [Luteimicrobium sp. DT211]|uniref:phospholipase D-like domain-containing protein n=1 Tax=Luteimicrobium sp. DT211 TaxID=3393412 RepID=UPI003CF823D3
MLAVLLGSALGAAPVAEAAKVSVDAHLSTSTYLRGQTVAVAGTARGVSKGTKVRLERSVGSSWRSAVAGKTTTAAGAYRMQVAMSSTALRSGTHHLRVVVLGATGKVKAVSSRMTLRHATCTASARPSAISVSFTQATASSGAALANKIKGSICAAANGATVTVSMYILNKNDARAKLILDALRYVHAERGVGIRFVLETGVNDFGGIPASTVSYLRSFARVTTCRFGCGPTVKMHDKLLAISDTRWRSGTDPLVVMGSANWSDRQFDIYWQTETFFYGDRSLYRDAVAHQARMRTCGAGLCSTIRSVLGAPWVRGSRGYWGVSGDPVLPGSAGSGLTYQYLPAVTSRDNVVDTLKSVTCHAGGTVRVAMFTTTDWRARTIGTQLGRLRKEGCDVRVVAGQGTRAPTAASAISALHKASGVAPRCVYGMHAKYVALRGVEVHGKRGQSMVLDGSENWTTAALRTNDESEFVLSTATATTSRATLIRQVAQAYTTQWGKIGAHAAPCGSIS